jgi:hypothetical protein
MGDWAEQTAHNMGNMAVAIQQMADRVQAIVTNRKQHLPKGLRVSARRLKMCSDFATATEAFLSEFAQNGTPEMLMAMQKAFGSESKIACKYVIMQEPKVMELIDSISVAVESSNSKAQEKSKELKRKVMAIHSQIRQMADALCRTKVETTDTSLFAEVVTVKNQIVKEPWVTLLQ